MDIQKKWFTREPSQSSGRWLTGKIFIWLVVWGIIAILLFVILSFVWWVFTDSMSQTWWFTTTNPILPLVLLLIGFLSSFIGNIAISGIYNLFFSERYLKTAKTMWILLLTNAILFVFFAPIYLIYAWDINTLFILLWFHIMFSVFLSTQQMETVSNPNYWSSSLIWTTLGFVITVLIYSLVRKSSSMWGAQNKLYLLLLIPPIISFGIMPLWAWIRERIYYKMYEVWNNWFYNPPLEEDGKKDIEFENNGIDENDDINIDLQ